MTSTRLLASVLLLPLFSCASAPPAPEESVRPGINEKYLEPDMAIEEWVERFEVESREVFAEREAIAAAVGLEPGDRMADVGAGTGMFLDLFANHVGATGEVFAVDIAPRFLQHLRERVEAEGWSHVTVHEGTERSVQLPANSIDVAFLCDVYHHLEYPRSSMGSIHSALSAGGEVVIVDFERIPGVTREWILGHVRAGKAGVIAEMDSFGFDLVEELTLDGLEENYAARFRKR